VDRRCRAPRTLRGAVNPRGPRRGRLVRRPPAPGHRRLHCRPGAARRDRPTCRRPRSPGDPTPDAPTIHAPGRPGDPRLLERAASDEPEATFRRKGLRSGGEGGQTGGAVGCGGGGCCMRSAVTGASACGAARCRSPGRHKTIGTETKALAIPAIRPAAPPPGSPPDAAGPAVS
jgi:hypothetical protein